MIRGDMIIEEVLERFPHLVEVFRKRGLPCPGCILAERETIEQGAAAYELDLQALLADLNAAVK